MENTSVKYAGFWIRAIAYIIDSIILMIIMLGLMFVLGAGIDLESLVAADGALNSGSGMAIAIMYILPIILVIGLWTKFQATPGKMILGLKIVDAKTGGGLGLVQCIIRYLAYFVSFIPLMLGFIWIGLDKRKQGFHDKISSTVVIFK